MFVLFTTSLVDDKHQGMLGNEQDGASSHRPRTPPATSSLARIGSI